jgi:hypothetical protein
MLYCCNPSKLRSAAAWMIAALLFKGGSVGYTHKQPCMQRLGNAACMLCMVGAIYFNKSSMQQHSTCTTRLTI